MNNVLSLILLISQNTLRNDLMYNIACYMVDNITNLKNKTIKQISEECFISTTSVIKFCQLIGFDNFSDFKRELLSNYETRKLQLFNKHQYLTVQDLMDRIQKLSINQIDQKNFLERIDKIINLIIQKKRINIYGAVFPLALTQSFAEDMAVMDIPVRVFQISKSENHIEKREGINIIITLSGRFIETNRNEYNQICEMNDATILLSKESEYIGKVSMNIPLPQTISSDYDDIILLLILDIIKLKFDITRKLAGRV